MKKANKGCARLPASTCIQRQVKQQIGFVLIALLGYIILNTLVCGILAALTMISFAGN